MKKIRPELKPSFSGRPGEGVLVLSGWDLESLEIGASAEVCVQRNQDHRYLGEHGQWGATQTWHQVSLSEEQVDGSVVLALAAGWVDPLVENPQMAYQLQTRIGAEQAIGVLRIRSGVLSSRASGQSAEPTLHVAGVARTSPVQEVVIQTVEPAEPVELAQVPARQSEAQPSKTGLWVALGGLLVLLVVGFFAWKFFGDTGQSPATPVAASIVTPLPVLPVAPAPCSAEALAASKDDLLFIQSCLKTNPDSTQVLAVIAMAKESKRCDVVQRLYAFKGQSGDSNVALAYAREFDPATFVAGCLAAADKETAVYWYELVLSKEPENADAKARLDALRK